MAAPVLMTTLTADWGQPGWLALAVIFLIPAAAAIPVTRWAVAIRASSGGVPASPTAEAVDAVRA